jgi:hypothetical protein
VFAVGVGTRRRSFAGLQVIGLILALGLSTVWMASCGGSGSSNKNPGTPVGTYSITVNATTTTGGPSSSTTFNLTVAP